MLSEFKTCEKYIEQYVNLGVSEKIHCLDQYIHCVIPYDADELPSIKAIEGSIYYTLSDEQYSIDKNGDWLCEGAPMCPHTGHTVEEMLDKFSDDMDIGLFDDKQKLKLLSGYDGLNSIDPKYNSWLVTDYSVSSDGIVAMWIKEV